MAHPGFEQMSARQPPAPGPREARPPPARIRRPPAARVAMAHGAWLSGLGLLSLLARRASRRIAGPEPEGWLAKGLGTCMANIGAVLAAAGGRGRVAREVRILGFSTALSLAAMDLWYGSTRRRSSPVYLLNGAAHLAFAAAWGWAEWRESLDRRRAPEAAFA